MASPLWQSDSVDLWPLLQEKYYHIYDIPSEADSYSSDYGSNYDDNFNHDLFAFVPSDVVDEVESATHSWGVQEPEVIEYHGDEGYWVLPGLCDGDYMPDEDLELDDYTDVDMVTPMPGMVGEDGLPEYEAYADDSEDAVATNYDYYGEDEDESSFTTEETAIDEEYIPEVEEEEEEYSDMDMVTPRPGMVGEDGLPDYEAYTDDSEDAIVTNSLIDHVFHNYDNFYYDDYEQKAEATDDEYTRIHDEDYGGIVDVLE